MPMMSIQLRNTGNENLMNFLNTGSSTLIIDEAVTV
jgi:hypothetical protein